MKQLMALFRWLILAGVAATSFLAGRCGRPADLPTASVRSIDSETLPILEAVRKLSPLVVTRVAVAEISQTRIDGYLGGITAVLFVRGDFLLGVDLSAVNFAAVDPERRSVVIVLPPPTVSSPRLDREKTRLLCITRQGLWSIIPGDAGQQAVVNHAYLHTQGIVAAAGSDPKLREEARHRAESILNAFFSAIGWKVDIHWADRP